MSSSDQPRPAWTPGTVLRLLVFLLLAAFVVGQPTARQAFGVKRPRWIRSWQMFVGFGTDICDVRYTAIDPDGGRLPVDPVALMGYASRREAPRSLWRMDSEEDIERWGRRLCRELDDAVDLRVVSRCASREGWVAVHDGSESLCEDRRP